MAESPTNPRTSRLAQAAAALAAASITCALIAIIGVQWSYLAPVTSFGLFTVGALLGGALTLILGIISLFTTRGGRDRVGRRRAWSSSAVGAILLLVVVGSAARGMGAPAINDITTSPGSPPKFVHALTLPENQGRDMSYSRKDAVITRQSYPDLKGIDVAVQPQNALPIIIEAARKSGWTITAIDGKQGVVEATDTTPIFRFVDDIVVRYRPLDANNITLDVRSKSRDGKGDLGANAARIRRFDYELGRLTKPAR